MAALDDWTADTPADVVDLTRAGALAALVERYGGAQPRVLSAVLGHAEALRARTAVIEYRYIDADYRALHTGHYGLTFRRYPSIAHRLHFFSGPVPADLASASIPARFSNTDYLGYTVLRPLPGAPVGRTMLPPTAETADSITCLAEDTVNLLGEELTVRAAPFVAQDAQLSICAHADLWMVAHYHHLRFGARRVTPRDIVDAVPHHIGRTTPSAGLSMFQMSVVATKLGLPALVYQLIPPPKNQSVFRIACRYLNSGLPVIVGAGRHVFVLVGYERLYAGTPDERIRFFRHDDERGLYEAVDNVKTDRPYGDWKIMAAPLPEKVFLSGEDAEVIGRVQIQRALTRSTDPAAQEALRLLSDPARPLGWRSTVIRSNEFKLGLDARSVPAELAAVYRRMPMSRWIWVVELVNRDLRNNRQPCVLAEAVVDATDNVRDQHALAVRLPTRITWWDPDRDKVKPRQLAAVPLLLPASVSTGIGRAAA